MSEASEKELLRTFLHGRSHPCPICGYDLRDLRNDRCPECGRQLRLVVLIDDHPRFRASPIYLDLPVQSIAQAVEAAACGTLAPTVVLSTDTYEDQFWLQTAPLREGGVSVFRLYG